MQAQFRIHFTDNYGSATISCNDWDEYRAALENLQGDPDCEDIWTEYFDEEEGWQA